MAVTKRNTDMSRLPPGAFSTAIETDFSAYTLRQLFEARYWVDPERSARRSRYLEMEIHKRCAHIRERINGEPAADESAARFRPYGLILGLIVLIGSIGPYIAAEGLDLIHVHGEVDRDSLTLSGVWAMLTFPFAALAFVVGGIADAGRVVEWFDPGE